MKSKDDLELTRLKNRYVMGLAHYLQEECNLSRSVSMKKAHLACRLLEDLGKGYAIFTFRKLDGTYRRAKGTLNPLLIPDIDATKKKEEGKNKKVIERAPNVCVFWDMEMKSWRSFRVERLVRIEKSVLHSND